MPFQIGGVPVPPDPTPGPPGSVLSVPWVGQEASRWCWAACAGMVLAAKGIPSRQCELASWAFEQDCCDPAAGASCDLSLHAENSLLPADIRRLYAQWNIGVQHLRGFLPHDALLQQLQQRVPVQVFYQWFDSGAAHTALVTGYDPNTRRFWVLDPYADVGQGWCTHANLLGAYGSGRWVETLLFTRF